MTDTIQSLAGELAKAFVSDIRTESGAKFYKLRVGSPEWMSDTIQAAHDGMFPDDMRYQMIMETAFRMSDADDGEIEDSHEAVDGLVDVYTADLTRWLASHNTRMAYVEEAMNEYGWPREGGMTQALMMGQFAEYREIWARLTESLTTEEEARDAA